MPTLLQLQKIKDSYFIFYKKLRFIDFDAKYLNEIPFVFKPLTPPIHFAKSMILDINSYLGLPWWLVLMISAFFVRVCIFPLVLIQMKKMSKFGPVWPILVHLKEGFKTSNFKRFTNIVSVYNIYKFISKSEKIRIRSIFIYNLAYYPLLITMVYAIRNVLGDPLLSDASFLYLNTLTDIDPYYILPTLTISIYYYNFERFITP